MGMAEEKESSPVISEALNPSLTSPVAIFPQYIPREPTTIMICEAELPNPKNDFVVFLPGREPLFHINREHGNWHFCQRVVDSKTKANVLTIRRNRDLFMSFRFEDNSEKEILDLQGKAYVRIAGARATASFINSIDQNKVELDMHGSWHNYQATIKNKATQEMVAKMQSEAINFRAYRGRRDYQVEVSAGVDLAVIAGMIICLDVRSSNSYFI